MSESDSFPFPFPSKRKSHITYLSRIKRSRSDEERDTQVVMLSSDEEVDIVDMYESNDEEDDEDDDPLLLSPMIPLTPKAYHSQRSSSTYFTNQSNETYQHQHESTIFLNNDNDTSKGVVELRSLSKHIMNDNEQRPRINHCHLLKYANNDNHEDYDDQDEIDALSWSPIATSTPRLTNRSLPLTKEPLLSPLELREGEAKRRKTNARSGEMAYRRARRGSNQGQEDEDEDVIDLQTRIFNVHHPGREIAGLRRTGQDERLEDSGMSSGVMRLGNEKRDETLKMIDDRLPKDIRGRGMTVRNTTINTTPTRRVRFSLPAEETTSHSFAPYPVNRRNTTMGSQRRHSSIVAPIASPRTSLSARSSSRFASIPLLEGTIASPSRRPGTPLQRLTRTRSIPPHLEPLNPSQTRGRQIDDVLGRSTSWSNEVERGEFTDEDALAFGIGNVFIDTALDDHGVVNFGDVMLTSSKRVGGAERMDEDQKDIDSPRRGMVWSSPVESKTTTGDDPLEYDRSSSEEETLIGESPMPVPRKTMSSMSGNQTTRVSKRPAIWRKARSKMMAENKAKKTIRRVGSRSSKEIFGRRKTT